MGNRIVTYTATVEFEGVTYKTNNQVESSGSFGHDYSGAPATCTEPQVCAREGCGVVLDEAKGHDYSGPDATCTEAKVCAVCGVVLEEAKGHDYSGDGRDVYGSQGLRRLRRSAG